MAAEGVSWLSWVSETYESCKLIPNLAYKELSSEYLVEEYVSLVQCSVHGYILLVIGSKKNN